MSKSLAIRPAKPEDVSLIRSLIQELAAYEEQPEAAVVTEADLLRDGFGPEPYFHCLMAEWDEQPAGFALYFFQYSTWEGRPSLYLEDLFVRPQFRKFGIGRTLLQSLARIAVNRQCARFQWECLNWNQPSLDFYETLGAKVLPEWLNLRMTKDAIEKLADGF
jgi:GNAT superfamily N-acetyltransferase